MMNFIKKSFKREILACFLVVALVPLLLSGAFLVRMFEAKLTQDNRQKDMAQATEIEAKFETLFDDFQQVTETVQADAVIKDALKKKESGSSAIYTQLYGETIPIREKGQVELYSADGVCRYSTGTGMVDTTLPPYWGILKVATAHPDELIVRREKSYMDEADILLRAARAIQDEQGEYVGYVVVSMNEEHFYNVLQGAYDRQDGVCILNSFWETVYSNGIAQQENIGQVLRRRLLDGETLERSYQGNSVYISQLGDTGLISVLLRPEIFTEDTLRSMYSMIFLMAFASMLLCIVVAARMSNHLSWPIRVLNHAMHKLQDGDLNTRINSERQDEFGQLSTSFNTMAKELKNNVERQVSQQKELNDVQIAMMQAQLNPHFLYNTLDTMKWVAKANHIPEMATLAAKLAKILRTSISKEQFIPLREEVELVDSYMEIQKIRFDGKFQFVCQLPEELAECMVPKLIIQPIVENAVIHGLSESEDGIISVTISATKSELHIVVQDDGCGIDIDRMELINERRWGEISGHIGLRNVDTILRLHYGEKYGLKVERPQVGGTRMILILPYESKVEEREA